jgi:DNA-dependent RNA polymerase
MLKLQLMSLLLKQNLNNRHFFIKKQNFTGKTEIYSEEFKTILSKTLGHPTCFLESKKETQIKISKDVKRLFNADDFTKAFFSGAIETTFWSLYSHMKPCIDEFLRYINLELTNKTYRKNSASMSNNLYNSLDSLAQSLKSELGMEVKVNLKEVISNITADHLLHAVMISITRNLEEKSGEKLLDYKTDVVILSSMKFASSCRNSVFYLLIMQLISVEKHYETISENYTILSNIIHLNKLIDQIESICKKSIFEDEIFYKNADEKYPSKFYKLPLCLKDYKASVAHLPEITEPEAWNNSTDKFNVTFIKRIINGKSSILLSDDTTEALSWTQKKKFIISETALNFFENLDKISYQEYRSIQIDPIVPLSVVEEYDRRVADTKSNIFDSLTYQKIRNIRNELPKNISEKNFLDALKCQLGITEDQYKLNREAIQNIKDLKSFKEQRYIFKSVLAMARIYSGFPIYFFNSVDYRLRMYPWSFLFSRTTGVYKYLLNDFEKEKLNKEGLRSMLSVYYVKDKDLYRSFQKQKTVDEMLTYFRENKINPKETSNYIYFCLLEQEIGLAIDNGLHTNFMVEVDQKSSSSVFISLAFRNQKLAKYSNLLDKKGYDIPTYLGEQTEAYFSRLNIKNEFLLESFKKIRGLHKQAFMNFCYNQQPYGRLESWKKQLMKERLSDKDYEDLKMFSTNYEGFLEEVFPKLIQQKTLLNSIIDVVIANTSTIKLTTLDKSHLSWTIFELEKSSKNVIKVKDPLSKKFHSRRIHLLNTRKTNTGKLKRSFLPGLIHSIDAGVIRILIRVMWLKHKYLINHVHDSVMMHPNYTHLLYSHLTDLYSNGTFDCLLEKTVICPSLNAIEDEFSKEKIASIFKEVSENFDDFNITRNCFDIQNIYRPE